MASLVNERFLFLHVPKTGGTWAVEAMLAAGALVQQPPDVPFHASLAELGDYTDRLAFDRLAFAFVRHPLDWWRSYWGYRMRTGWEMDKEIDALAASEDFGEFIDGVVRHLPGAASAIYETYVGPPSGGIDFIGRQERLADDLCKVLRLVGEPFDERLLRAHPPVNVHDYDRHPARYTRRAAERLAAAERAAIERFYPWEPIPARLLGESARVRRSSGVIQRLERAELALRDERAELVVARLDAERRERALRECERTLRTRDRDLQDCTAALADAQHSLALLQSSRLMRWSAPLRRLWYRTRAGGFEVPVDTAHAPAAVDSRGSLAVGPTAGASTVVGPSAQHEAAGRPGP